MIRRQVAGALIGALSRWLGLLRMRAYLGGPPGRRAAGHLGE